MPSRSKSSTIVAPQGGILLLEEYDALAAAIGSALKKFAPKHQSAIARSLAEGEKLTAQLNPELFVLDVDPPWPGLANFLDKISDMLPNSRVLVIGATIPTEITAERGQAGALQFIEKPFDLAAFGAAVQALLGAQGQNFVKSIATNGPLNLAIGALFVYFALSFFGYYEIALPQFLNNFVNKGLKSANSCRKSEAASTSPRSLRYL